MHRNGKTKDDKSAEITVDDIKAVLKGGLEMASQVEKLVEHYHPEVDDADDNGEDVDVDFDF